MNDDIFTRICASLSCPIEGLRDLALRERNRFRTGAREPDKIKEALWTARIDFLNEAISNMSMATNICDQSPVVLNTIK